MILFAAATGLRPAEWVALEKCDIDRDERVVYVRRSYTRGEVKLPKTEGSLRAVPLQARAIDALDRRPAQTRRSSSPASAAGTSTSITFVRTNGGRRRKLPASVRFGGSTISGTPSPPSPFVPASPPSTSPATWAPA
jgi:integrase